ncbi:MAG: hypothetical protein LQ346_004873 [Caloplaca aetnensis]|nr:MAG: hypothetical protein LQ346_004873 [Caloplaca aetnensis]
MPLDSDLQPRQIWANPTPTSTSLPRHCTPFRLLPGGLLDIGDGSILTLSQEAVFQPYCTEMPELTANLSTAASIEVEEKGPFYSSTLPQMYAMAAVTVVSYLLVIILFITPRTFFVGGLGGSSRLLGHGGMIRGASRSNSVVGVGGRPWLQKVAGLTVAISLTIASYDIFRAAERQYDGGYSDATALTNEVVSSLELRIVRVISETFLWLAQTQTLIRLFPRHKEKVIIKWAGFVLIAFDTIFSILNNFVSQSSKSAPQRFGGAVPALSYLFTFCLSLMYAAWIIYYSLSKRRFAFFHHKMRNICLVALLSYVAVLIPVVFFVLDISIYDVAGWGNYVRWVGAAAASVVVWEWVERIEALERDERKDGILGREIFDGDEMLDITPSSAATGGNGGTSRRSSSSNTRGIPSIMQRINRKCQRTKPKSNHTPRTVSSPLANEYPMAGTSRGGSLRQSQRTPSTMTSIPVRGLDSTQPGSRTSRAGSSPVKLSSMPQSSSSDIESGGKADKPITSDLPNSGQIPKSWVAKTFWDTLQRIPIPFLSRHMSPPIEVKQAVRSSQQPGIGRLPELSVEPPGSNGPSLLDRLSLKKSAPAPKAPLPITVVPAPPRNQTSWSEVRIRAGSPPIPPSLSRPLSHDLLDRRKYSATPLGISQGQSERAPNVADNASSHAPAPIVTFRNDDDTRSSHAAQATPIDDRAGTSSGRGRPLSRASLTSSPATHTGAKHTEPSASTPTIPRSPGVPQAHDGSDTPG